MKPSASPVNILMAEDDADDRLLARDAFEQSNLANQIRFMEDGLQLTQYLRHEGDCSEAAAHPAPDLT